MNDFHQNKHKSTTKTLSLIKYLNVLSIHRNYGRQIQYHYEEASDQIHNVRCCIGEIIDFPL